MWPSECQSAFDIVKYLLCCLSTAPRLNEPFKLQVDTSKVAAGAILLQEGEDDINKPVCYFSRKFNAHQLKYSMIEKEALALTCALQ